MEHSGANRSQATEIRRIPTQQTEAGWRTEETELPPVAVLATLRGGPGVSQIRTDSLLALSHTIGNSALSELLSDRQPLDPPPYRFPDGSPATEPGEWGETAAGQEGYGAEGIAALAPLAGGTAWAG